jgi:hypothetical protein
VRSAAMAGAAGGFVTRALEAMLKECAANRGKFAALQQSIQSYLGACPPLPFPSSRAHYNLAVADKGAVRPLWCLAADRWHQRGAEGSRGRVCCCGHHGGAGVGGARTQGAPSRAGAAAASPRLPDQARQARGTCARLSSRNRSPLFLLALACSAACLRLCRS